MNQSSLFFRSFLLLLTAVSIAFIWVLLPYYGAIFWGAILAVIFHPLNKKLLAAFHGRPNLAALVTLLFIILMVILPTILIFTSLAQEGVGIYKRIESGEVNFGSIGHGSAMHLAGQLYMQQTGSNMVHVPYTSASLAVSNLISGQIQAMFQVVPAILPQLRTGEVRPLALMNPQRIPALPDVPTADEAGYAPLRSSVWLALMAPAQTPDAVIQHINEALNAALADESVRRGLEDLGAIPGGGSPEEARTVLQQSRIHWQALMREADPPMR
jgi:hypothetical protein